MDAIDTLKALGPALGRVLVTAGVIRDDTPMTGPELLVAAESYATYLATLQPSEDDKTRFFVMRPYGEVTGKAEYGVGLRGSKKPPRYRRAKRKAEEAAQKRRPRKAERTRARREIEQEKS